MDLIKSIGRRECETYWGKCGGKPELYQCDNLEDSEKEIAGMVGEFVRENGDLKKGSLDVSLGLELYCRILSFDRGFTMRQASDDGVWRRMALDIVPEVVRLRWPVTEKGQMRKEYFWHGTSRLWLKGIWWYAHLSWQGDEKSTNKVLSCGTTDTKQALVERPGPAGFRVEMCREIMKRLPDLLSGKDGEAIFRALMILNTAKVRLNEPVFFDGGIEGYVDSLIASLEHLQ